MTFLDGKKVRRGGGGGGGGQKKKLFNIHLKLASNKEGTCILVNNCPTNYSNSKLKKNRSMPFDIVLVSLMLALNRYLLIGIEILLQFFKTSAISTRFWN